MTKERARKIIEQYKNKTGQIMLKDLNDAAYLLVTGEERKESDALEEYIGYDFEADSVIDTTDEVLNRPTFRTLFIDPFRSPHTGDK